MLLELADGAELHYEVEGDGPAVVFLHPGLWDARTWDPQVPSFVAAGFRVIRYDLRGFGRSSRLDGSAFSPVLDLVALLDHLDIAEAALVGCSIGGGVAIDTAVEHPERLWALVPVASALSGFEDTEDEEAWFEAATEGFEEAMDAGDLERAQLIRLRVWAPLGMDDEHGRAIRDIAFDNLHDLTQDESGWQTPEPPAAVRLNRIDAPTLVVKASHDPPFMKRCNDLIAAGIPGARVVLLEGADHVANLRQPAAFDAAVLPFLDGVRPR
ncbi:MAG TPA: alpha/beta hydrolase [Actinomycetota bacterium]